MTNAELLNECGSKISAVYEAGLEALKTADAETAAKVREMMTHAGKAGKALQAVADSVLPKKPGRNEVRDGPPREVPGAAADDPTYVGTLTWQQLTHTDWAYYFKNGLDSRQTTIFVEKPKYINPNTGANYNNRDAEFRNADGSYMDLTGYAGPLLGK